MAVEILVDIGSGNGLFAGKDQAITWAKCLIIPPHPPQQSWMGVYWIHLVRPYVCL